MNAVELWLRLAAGLFLIGTNGFFVAIEFALTRARQFSEREFVGDGHAALERAWEMTQNLELYLTTCQVGITASSIAVGIVAEPALAAVFEPLFAGSRLAGIGGGAVIAFLLINLVHLTHGEQTPTYLGVERSRMVCRYGATPLYWFHYAITPLIRLGDRVAKLTLGLFGVEMTGAWLETEEDVVESRADLRNRLGTVLEEGDLPDERRDEVMNALAIDRIEVEDVMVPREEVAALSLGDTSETTLATLGETPHTRFPLVDGSLDDPVGVVYVPALVRDWAGVGTGEATMEEVAAPLVTVSPDLPVSELIDRLQREGQELALVVEDGRTVGLVTATDGFEAIAGELTDPLDEESEGRERSERPS